MSRETTQTEIEIKKEEKEAEQIVKELWDNYKR
jgi:hypothetical protein